MGLGWTGNSPFGLDARLRMMVLDRLAAQQRDDVLKQQAFNNAMTLRNADRADAQMAQAEQDRQARDAENAANKQALDADRQFKEDQTLNESIPADSFIAPTSPIVGRLQRIGAVRPQEARPEVTTGPLLPGDTGAALDEGFLKNETAKQANTRIDNERQAQAAKDRGDEADWRLSIQQQLADMKAGQPAGGADHFQLQPEIDPKTGAQTGRFLGYNTKTNRFEPIAGVTPQSTKPAPGAAQAAQSDRAKTEALTSLDQLDQAIEEAKDLVGPGAGRISNLEQMAGSADPRIQRLNAKMKAVKMQVDHAITGSVRAGASPMMMQQWDNILANKVDPAGLKAGVQAMREILGGQTAAPAPAGGGKTYRKVNGQWVAQ